MPGVVGTCVRLFLVALSVAGCATSVSPADRDAAPVPPDGDGGPLVCDGVDRSCPSQVPLDGSACEGALACPYPGVFPGCGDSAVRCVEGRWEHPSACIPPGPLLAEGCDDVELGPFPDLTLTVDPTPSAFVWGFQGNAMIEHRIALAPDDDAPSCVRVRTRLTLDGESVETTRPVRLRCGSSLTIQEIVPGLPCDDRRYEGTLEIEVIGVGTETIDLSLPGGQPSGSGGRPVCDTTG